MAGAEAEPVRRQAAQRRAMSLRAHSHRLARSVMALAVEARSVPGPRMAAPLRSFADAVVATLQEPAQAVRTRPGAAAPTPDLRALQRGIAGAAAGIEGDQYAAARLQVLSAETDRLADSLNSVLMVARRDAPQDPADREG